MDAQYTAFTAHQRYILSIIERTCSSISIAGSLIIILTFIGSTRFRKPINRLVFFAACGNVMCNVATLVSVSGLDSGSHSGLCQFQAFFLQWFMASDALWTFAMACNVYLALFRKHDTEHLRNLEWRYMLLCYGVPFVPALVLLFIKNDSQGKVYGKATQWCWISTEWDYLQIGVFYGPIWLVIAVNFIIYTRVGWYIYRGRRELNHFRSPDTEMGPEFFSSMDSDNRTVQTETTGRSSMERVSLEHSDIPHPDSAVRAYTKYALTFFLAMFITWIPSIANRIYALATPANHYIFGLTSAASFVLPLQGFWNCVIYIVVSWDAMSSVLKDLRHLSFSKLGSVPIPSFRIGSNTSEKD
ncbi:family A G protein-coupled receptor-like protein [Aspergillus campestris IBT 28561]|uniref:Family A G protein-coupled receptor-like protein n=1 Tax=Aspergillus campestris (strain IBT 28561) TaxID=1392248 RepID=A0A2I1CW31_ASPC2|nr:family A G protein-coupled receptor-like protein [Aspergillus campestris IBT 28561]PKY01827.1 family A G protein-coupled receptor-like protein [Aspergillus campestris IBT 28561]